MIAATVVDEMQAAEQGITDAVSRANQAIQRIAQINRQVGVSNDAGTAALLDERDRNIDDLAQLMDITVVPGDNNQVSVYTGSGMQLAGVTASVLNFDGRSSLDAMSHWDSNPTKRSVGTLTLTDAAGNSVDLIADHAIRSGQIKAYLELHFLDFFAESAGCIGKRGKPAVDHTWLAICLQCLSIAVRRGSRHHQFI